MKYYSTNRQSALVDFREATIEGLAPDKGLYFPEAIPQIDPHMIENIKSYSNVDIAFNVMKPYVEGALPDGEIAADCSRIDQLRIPACSHQRPDSVARLPRANVRV